MKIEISPVTRLEGRPRIPGDKSISHRALLFGALANGTTEVSNLLESGDVHSTWRCLEAMGAKIERVKEDIRVTGGGLRGFKKPSKDLDCGNSGTTIRHLMGILAGQSFESRLVGDASLSKRPMRRIAEPLTQMGARFRLSRDQFAPLEIHGAGKLSPLKYSLPVASAQLKSALLLAGLYAEGETVLEGLIHSRDHTERLLPHFGVRVNASEKSIAIRGGQELRGSSVNVPGDPSTAAFWLGAAALVQNSNIQLDNILLNPTRSGFIEVLRRMGCTVETELKSKEPEWVGSIRVSHARLRGTEIQPDEVPSLIDEIPLIAILASQAEGATVVRGAEELRVKESDRIEAVASNLRAMGAKIETFSDGFAIEGPQKLRGVAIDSHLDHRIAMSFSVAGLIANGNTEISGAECVEISYPAFFETLRDLTS